MSSEEIENIIKEVAAGFPASETARISRGIRQVAKLWQVSDGNAAALADFCRKNYAADESQRAQLLQRFDRYVEILYGYELAVTRELREAIDLAGSAPTDLDELFFAYNPLAGVQDDLFRNKAAFIALLNFPQYSLQDLLVNGPNMSRSDWAAARLTKRFGQRIPAAPKMAVNEAMAAAESYINNYNINLSQIIDGQGQKPFPAGKKLIAHWGLRDELKALYADSETGLAKQRMIVTVMERIITQDMPANFVNSDDLQYVLASGELKDQSGQAVTTQNAADERYQKLLDIFHAMRQIDAYTPDNPSHLDRIFNIDREMPVTEVEQLLKDVLEAPVGAEVAKLISKRLGRPLEPFDIWYDGFKVRSTISESALDEKVKAAYADHRAFQKELPNILQKLSFDQDTANFLSTKITVDSARGAGHAMQAGMRSDNAHLRTRVPAGGLDYKGFNIAIHELGHNVEEVLSLNKIDWVLLAGIPNTGFTEAFAFLFQNKDLEVLGVEMPEDMKTQAQAFDTLDNFWSVREIAGVALLDIQVWKYMYAHPDINKSQLKEAVITMAKDLWNKYYAPVLGTGESTLLAIYSHMICYGLYLPDYPMGHLIHYQISNYMQDKVLGREFERMATAGAITPNAWMQNAVGEPLSAAPIIKAAGKALESVR